MEIFVSNAGSMTTALGPSGRSAYSMIALQKFPGLLDDFWKAGAGDAFTLLDSDVPAYKRMVKACADAYPYVIVRGVRC